MRFYVGAPEPSWLARADVPLFVAWQRIERALVDRPGRRRQRNLWRARCSWALDSGAFTELRRSGGRFESTPRQYATAAARYRDEIGNLTFASPQDWMVEDDVLAITGLSVVEHQARTVGSFLDLMAADPSVPWVPVLQGRTIREYVACLARYEAAGVDVLGAPLVGLGSVCRRQSTAAIGTVVDVLAGTGVRLHAFGVKTNGLARYGDRLVSADSMAWSRDARWTRGRRSPNRLDVALAWRADVVAQLDRPRQLSWGLA